jgi:hypothetical protein
VTDIKELDKEYKSRFFELADKLGRNPDVYDREYWDLTEWHKTQYQPEPKDVFDEPVEDYKPAGKSAPAKSKPIASKQSGSRIAECRKCHAPFEKPAKRGRPPVHCEKCR